MALHSRPWILLPGVVFSAGDVGVAGRGGEDSQGPTLPPAQAVLPLQQDTGSAQRIHRFEGEQSTLAGASKYSILDTTV